MYTEPWLYEHERDRMIEMLLSAGVIKYDNARSLPLKNKSKTDIYVNLREMRGSPPLSRELAGAYTHALRRLPVDRIVDVPLAVSPMVGAISDHSGYPIVTVREDEKIGRATKGLLIGDVKFGDRLAIIDDVITDGASKLQPIRELRGVGARISAVVVLVDRQQGWQQTFKKHGIDVPVWSGMKLHDIRRYLIKNGIMQRCDPVVEERNPFIVALDGMTWDEALAVADRMRPTGSILKANDLVHEGNVNWVIESLSVYGRLMLDVKLHEIPNTVKNYCTRIRKTPPWAITVHGSGGPEMVKAAVDAFAGTPTIVLVVTVLTSIDERTCEEIYCRRPIEEVEKIATLAYEVGARGFVCSPEEVGMLRGKFPDATLVVPGCRSPGMAVGDQKRVATFTEARSAGADFLVGGRQFIGADDPVAEQERVMREELGLVS